MERSTATNKFCIPWPYNAQYGAFLLKALRRRAVQSCGDNKDDRRLVRNFLTVADTQSLSFKLLQVVHFGVRLPFLCLSLILTYLIILLQFGKLVKDPLMSNTIY
ncbi:hypothetical protein EVAR_17177_1 [Eumeta japonica]|uniref:Uncharacterized protein n=1 Tax=Eumeta variegata TaxID=151549 RepID=A0A4C1U8R3_EUMVA|nr:hypothetical protein EVAR_17177_1 [Eumeta japonica]